MEKAIVLKLEDLEKEISDGKRRGLLGALQIGRALSRIQSSNLFLSDGCDNFAQYVERAHGFKRSTAYNMIAVYTTWGQAILANPEFQSVDPSRLIRLLPFIDKDDPADLLRDAVFVPGKQAFEDNLRNRAGKVASDDEHKHLWEPWLKRCSICHKTVKIKEGV